MSSFHPPHPYFEEWESSVFGCVCLFFNPPTSFWGGDSGGISSPASIYKFLRRGGGSDSETVAREGLELPTPFSPPIHPNAVPDLTEESPGSALFTPPGPRYSPPESSTSSSFWGVCIPPTNTYTSEPTSRMPQALPKENQTGRKEFPPRIPSLHPECR